MSVDLDSITSLLGNSFETEETKDETEDSVENVTETIQEKPSKEKIDLDNKNYKDPIDEDYKLDSNNRMGCNVWKEDSNKPQMFIWNEF